MIRSAIPAFAVGLAALLIPSPLSSAPPPAATSAMVSAAIAFLDGLGIEQRSKATFAFDDDQRFEFRYTPRARTGLPVKEMTPAQRESTHVLLKTGVSLRGYATATTIIDLENVLHAMEPPRTGANAIVRDPELYFVSIFGTPGQSPWGWKFEGHHLSLNFTVRPDAALVFAPSFFGANPAIVRDGPKKGTRPLDKEEDAGRALLAALHESQIARVIFDATAPREMITAEARESRTLDPQGFPAGEMTPSQRRLLEQLIDVYLGRMPPEVAKERLAALQSAGIEKLTFGWAGTTVVGDPHYYRVQGPTFLIEYDNTQNEGNHIHSVWREFGSDFGRDLLREHYAAVAH